MLADGSGSELALGLIRPVFLREVLKQQCPRDW